MDKAWVEQKNRERLEKLTNLKVALINEIKNETCLVDGQAQRLLKDIETGKFISAESRLVFFKFYLKRDDIDDNGLADKVGEMLEKCRILQGCTYDIYLDSDPMEFDGDIVITDPCYLMRAEHHGTVPLTEDDWDHCNCGYEMENFGIHKHMQRSTLYGDWSCSVYNTDTKKKIGDFCADAGLVCVTDLAEIHRYNPDFDWYETKPWTTTLIQNFKGTVQFIVNEVSGVYEDTTKWWNAGDKWVEYEVEVVGHGVNKLTGEPINFVGKQTGL